MDMRCDGLSVVFLEHYRTLGRCNYASTLSLIIYNLPFSILAFTLISRLSPGLSQHPTTPQPKS